MKILDRISIILSCLLLSQDRGLDPKECYWCCQVFSGYKEAWCPQEEEIRIYGCSKQAPRCYCLACFPRCIWPWIWVREELLRWWHHAVACPEGLMPPRCWWLPKAGAAGGYGHQGPALSRAQGDALHTSRGTSPQCSDKCVEPSSTYVYTTLLWMDMFGWAQNWKQNLKKQKHV